CHLNIVASAKGLVAGDLKIYENKKLVTDGSIGSSQLIVIIFFITVININIRHVNQTLSGDPDLADKLPINISNMQLFDECRGNIIIIIIKYDDDYNNY